MTPKLETREVPAGKIIFREGQERNFAYIIKEGAVEIFKTVESRRVVLARLGEGDVFGEMAMLGKDRRTASAAAVEPCVLTVLDEAYLDRQSARSSKTMVRITRQLVQRLRQADEQYRARETNSSFLSVCVLMDLLYKNHLSLLKSGSILKKSVSDKDAAFGFEKRELEQAAKQARLISNPEIDAILDKLVRLNFISISRTKQGRTKQGRSLRDGPVERIKILSPDVFMECARNTALELKLAENVTDLEYLDLDDFSAFAGTTPELLVRKMALGEIPRELFAVHRERAEQWMEAKGKDVFRRPVRRKRPDQLEDVDDAVNVDNATLEEVLRRLGYYRTGLLYLLAGPDARRKLLDNMPKKAARILLEEDRSPSDISPHEAEEVQEEFIEAVRTAKRLSPAGKGRNSGRGRNRKKAS